MTRLVALGAHSRRTRLLMLVVVVLALSTAACGDGDEPRQQRIENPVRPDSINASIGTLRLLAVRIETPSDTVHVSGDNVGLFVTIANAGATADVLTAVSSVDAQKIVFRDGTGPAATGISVDIPPGGVASMQYPGGPHLELVGLKRDVAGGRFLPVTFRFKEAGVTTINVFVQGFAQPTVPPLSASPAPSG